jgi:hypothetical protein
MLQKDISQRLLLGFYVLEFSAFLLCLACYSYRARELLVCWLLFCSLFAVLALMLLGSVLAFHAGRSLVKWMRAGNEVISELTVCLAELPPEAIAWPGILATGALKLAAAPYAVVSVPDADSCVPIEIASPAEDDVSE